MSPVKTMQQRAEYTYVSELDNETELRLRCMSEKQRDQLFHRRWPMIAQQMSVALRDFDDDVYMKAYGKFRDVINAIAADSETREEFATWDSFLRITDVTGLFRRIQDVELAVAKGEDIPDQDEVNDEDEPEQPAIPSPEQVEAMKPEELEELGES